MVYPEVEASGLPLRRLLVDGMDESGSGGAALLQLADEVVRDGRVPDWLMEDGKQEALAAAVLAAPLWDEARSVPFEAFLRQRMRWAVQSYLRQADTMPASVRRDRRAVETARNTLSKEGVWNVSEEQLAVETGLTVQRIRHVLSWSVTADEEFAARLNDEGRSIESSAFQVERALRAVEFLPARERRIVERRYLAGEQTTEIAKSYGLSPGRVSQLAKRALATLRSHLG